MKTLKVRLLSAAAVSILACSALAPAPTLAAGSHLPGTYQLDPAHSKIGFEIPHLVISSVEGRFNDYQGEIILAEKLTDSKVSVTISTTSIDTGIQKRDDHLRSPDFFDAPKQPKISFKSKSVTGTPQAFKISGDLTIKGTTRQVTLDGKYLGTAKDAFGNQKAAFQAATKISRKDFGLTWNNMVEAGPVVGDEVTISLKIQATQKKDK